MSKIPSERINEINDKEIPFAIRDSNIGLIHAIIQYLDEQYEQQKPTTVKCGECGDEFEIENEGEDTCENCA